VRERERDPPPPPGPDWAPLRKQRLVPTYGYQDSLCCFNIAVSMHPCCLGRIMLSVLQLSTQFISSLSHNLMSPTSRLAVLQCTFVSLPRVPHSVHRQVRHSVDSGLTRVATSIRDSLPHKDSVCVWVQSAVVVGPMPTAEVRSLPASARTGCIILGP